MGSGGIVPPSLNLSSRWGCQPQILAAVHLGTQPLARIKLKTGEAPERPWTLWRMEYTHYAVNHQN